MSNSPLRYLLSHGPRSGRGSGAKKTFLAESRLRARGHQVEVAENGTVEQARQTFARAVDTAVDVLVVAGGDGLVGLAAGACANSDTALSIIPAGTGNDSARSFGIPLSTSAAVEVMLADHRSTVDLIDVAPYRRVVLGSVPVGIDARIAARATRLPRWWGSAVYAGAVLPELPSLRPLPYRLDLWGGDSSHTESASRTLEVEAIIVAVCNLPVYGGGMRIAPHADPTDGELDVVIITDVSARQALGLLRGVFTGRHLDHPSVQLLRGSQVTVSMTPPSHIAYGDGEPIGELPVNCRVRRGALTVIS